MCAGGCGENALKMEQVIQTLNLNLTLTLILTLILTLALTLTLSLSLARTLSLTRLRWVIPRSQTVSLNP